MLRFIIKLSVALHAVIAATFGRKIAPIWHERYLRQYVLMSLKRPNSYYLLTGENNHSKWLPSGPNLLASTGVISKWSTSAYYEPGRKTVPTRRDFRHANQTDLLANYHSDQYDEGKSQEELLIYFDDLTKAALDARVEGIDLYEDDEQDIDILDEDTKNDDDDGSTDVDTKN